MFDVCIIGAGVAGASMAAYLKDKNLKIALIDSSFKERDRIVGELLQPGGVFMLNKLGIGDVLKDIETCDIKGYSLFNKTKSIKIDYGTSIDISRLTGKGLNNGKFIQALRKKSENASNVVRITGKAIKFIEIENEVEGVVYQTNEGQDIPLYSKFTIVADGFSSNLRNFLHLGDKQVTSYFVGLVLKDCTLPQEGYGHIFMGGDAPFLCYRISPTEVRLLIDIPQTETPIKNRALDTYVLNTIKGQLPKSMHASLEQVVEKQNYKFMPNHYLNATPIVKANVAMVGDSLNMRHPLTGGGMTATLTDVFLLCEALIEGNCLKKGEALLIAISMYYAKRNDWNASINILADALYKVSLNPRLKEACFNYLAKGEQYSNQPIELLAGMNRDNTTLFKHFAQVALLGAKDNIMQEFGIKSIDSSLSLLLNASQILFPLIKKEKINLKNITKPKYLSQLAAAS